MGSLRVPKRASHELIGVYQIGCWPHSTFSNLKKILNRKFFFFGDLRFGELKI